MRKFKVKLEKLGIIKTYCRYYLTYCIRFEEGRYGKSHLHLNYFFDYSLPIMQSIQVPSRPSKLMVTGPILP